jgi:hypothetical protein
MVIMKIKIILVLIIGVIFILAAESITSAEDAIPAEEASKINPQDVEFLTKQCGIDNADIDVIRKLKVETREYLYALITKRDCKGLEPFKATREYLKKFNPPPDKSPFPPKGFKNDFLTEEESKYIDDINMRILDKVFENFK